MFFDYERILRRTNGLCFKVWFMHTEVSDGKL